MKLKSIEIKNFRCIRNLKFDVKEVGGSYTFALIGVNESGKSNFLEAIALMSNNNAELSQTDYFDKRKEVKITLFFELEKKDKTHLKHYFGSKINAFDQAKLSEIAIVTVFNPIKDARETMSSLRILQIPSDEETPDAHAVSAVFDPIEDGRDAMPSRRITKTPSQTQIEISTMGEMESEIPGYFGPVNFRIHFWKPDKNYLISQEINLQEFAENPQMSVPLRNCFRLAKLKPKDALVSDHTEESNIVGQLGDAVTKHINAVWPSHPVKVKFHISGGILAFLVEDNGVPNKSKVVLQRSDGFRHFISFLLTVSAQKTMPSWSNVLLLLDEPETHLHPQAQSDLRKELIKITQGSEGRRVLFFATHSNHMIDKKHIERCYKVSKRKNVATRFDGADSGVLKSYAEVNYSVFEVAGNDYHNELYGYLASTKEGWDKLKGLPIYSKPWHNERTGNKDDVSLPTYIRHSIHHPENKTNLGYTEAEFKESIETMQGLVIDLQTGNSGKASTVAPNAPVETDNES